MKSLALIQHLLATAVSQEAKPASAGHVRFAGRARGVSRLSYDESREAWRIILRYLGPKELAEATRSFEETQSKKGKPL